MQLVPKMEQKQQSVKTDAEQKILLQMKVLQKGIAEEQLLVFLEQFVKYVT